MNPSTIFETLGVDSDAVRTVILPAEQKFNLIGSWNPSKGLPTNPSKFDSYIVVAHYKEYNCGDYIIRNEDNTRWTHIKTNTVKQAIDDISYTIKRMIDRMTINFRKIFDKKIAEVKELSEEQDARQNTEINTIKLDVARLDRIIMRLNESFNEYKRITDARLDALEG